MVTYLSLDEGQAATAWKRHEYFKAAQYGAKAAYWSGQYNLAKGKKLAKNVGKAIKEKVKSILSRPEGATTASALGPDVHSGVDLKQEPKEKKKETKKKSTYDLATDVGFSPTEAFIIAASDYLIDWLPGTNPVVSWQWHFNYPPGRAKDSRDILSRQYYFKSLKDKGLLGLVELGVSCHPLDDKYDHLYLQPLEHLEPGLARDGATYQLAKHADDANWWPSRIEALNNEKGSRLEEYYNATH